MFVIFQEWDRGRELSTIVNIIHKLPRDAQVRLDLPRVRIPKTPDRI